MSVTNEAEREPKGGSIDASTMAVSMIPRRITGMAVRMKKGKISAGRGRGRPGCGGEEGEDRVGRGQGHARMLGIKSEVSGADGEIEEQGHQSADGREGQRALALP